MYWLFNLVFLGLAAYFFYKQYTCGLLDQYYVPTLVLKLSSGILVGVLYMYYYQEGDTLWFQYNSEKLTEIGRTEISDYLSIIFFSKDPGIDGFSGLINDPRSFFFIKILSGINFFTGNNYWINSLYFSFLGFMGSWLAVKALQEFFKGSGLPALLAFTFFPTTLFWSSGILKESLVLFSFGILLKIFLDAFMIYKMTPVRIIIFIAVFFIYWKIKYYNAAVFLMVISDVTITGFLIGRFKKMNGYLLFGVSLILLAFAISFLHPNLQWNGFFDLLLNNHLKMVDLSEGRNLVPMFSVPDPLINFFINIPVSLLGGLFMPLPGQAHGWGGWITGMFNLIILMLFFTRMAGGFGEISPKNRLLLSGAIFYIVFLAIFITYTTPNFGTLERYKVSYLPLFLFLLIFENKWLKTRRFIKKVKIHNQPKKSD